MTSKKFSNTLKLLGITAIATTAAKAVYRKISNKLYFKEGERAQIALEKMLEANEMEDENFEYVGDSGTVPIYLYDAKKCNLEKWTLPEGYILHKVIHPTGAVNYVLGKEIRRTAFGSYYPTLLYLEDVNEWQEEFGEEEGEFEGGFEEE